MNDPLAGLRNIPELWDRFAGQPAAVRVAYEDWWCDRVETKAAHRDCLEPFLAGYEAGQRSTYKQTTRA